MMELDPEARRLLALVNEARTPSAEDKLRVERRLALAVGAAAVAAPAVAAGQAVKGASLAKGAAGLLSLKWWIGGGVALSAAVVGYTNLAAPPAVVPVTRPARVVERHVEPVEPVVAAAPAIAAPAVEVVAQPEKKPARAAKKRTRDGLGEELDLLHRAQAAWRGGDARNAHQLLREHAARFPRSSLGVERDALTVLSLCELGHKEEARTLARRLIARAPNAPVRSTVEESCALR